MHVKYEDGPPEVAPVNTVDGPKAVERGEAVEVNREVGEQLVAQGWVEVKHHKRAKAHAEATTTSEEK